MVTAEYNTGRLGNPFVVMTGKTGGTLDKRYKDWEGLRPENTCRVAFQKKHWFDATITIRYLKWLKSQYGHGSQKIFLIWDHAPAHDARIVQEFIDKAEDDGWLVVKLIPGTY